MPPYHSTSPRAPHPAPLIRSPPFGWGVDSFAGRWKGSWRRGGPGDAAYLKGRAEGLCSLEMGGKQAKMKMTLFALTNALVHHIYHSMWWVLV